MIFIEHTIQKQNTHSSQIHMDHSPELITCYERRWASFLIKNTVLCCAVLICSVVSDFVTPWARLPGSFVLGDSPSKTTREGCHALLQGIFPTQELNQGLLHFRQILYQLCYQGSLVTTLWDYKSTSRKCESWIKRNAECQRIDTFKLHCWRRLLSPLECREIKPVNPKGNQLWIFIGRTDAEAEALIPWQTNADPLEKTWCWERVKAEGEAGNRGWDSWIVSLTQ